MTANDNPASLALRQEMAREVRYRAAGPACLTVRPVTMRPETMRLLPADAAAARAHGTIEPGTHLGAVVEYVVRLGPGLNVIVRGTALDPDAARRYRPDEPVSLLWSAAEERIFNGEDRPAPVLAMADGSQQAAFG